MFKPWGVEVMVDDHIQSVWAYHLEDLIDSLQEWMATNNTFLLRLHEGCPPLSPKEFADLLTRDYSGGRPDRRVEWMQVTLKNGTVIARCRH